MNVISNVEQPREEWRAGVDTRMLVSARSGSFQLCIFEQWIAPNKGAPTHSHPFEEVLSVVTGEAEIWIEDESAILTGGQSIVVPAHRKHGFRNVGSETLHLSAVLASSIFEATIDEQAPIRRWLP